jgi:hypothetical protein
MVKRKRGFYSITGERDIVSGTELVLSFRLIVFIFDSNASDCYSFQGEQLGQTEATETFFAMTKLFQSKDVSNIHLEWGRRHQC